MTHEVLIRAARPRGRMRDRMHCISSAHRTAVSFSPNRFSLFANRFFLFVQSSSLIIGGSHPLSPMHVCVFICDLGGKEELVVLYYGMYFFLISFTYAFLAFFFIFFLECYI